MPRHVVYERSSLVNFNMLSCILCCNFVVVVLFIIIIIIITFF